MDCSIPITEYNTSTDDHILAERGIANIGLMRNLNTGSKRGSYSLNVRPNYTVIENLTSITYKAERAKKVVITSFEIGQDRIRPNMIVLPKFHIGENTTVLNTTSIPNLAVPTKFNACAKSHGTETQVRLILQV